MRDWCPGARLAAGHGQAPEHLATRSEGGPEEAADPEPGELGAVLPGFVGKEVAVDQGDDAATGERREPRHAQRGLRSGAGRRDDRDRRFRVRPLPQPGAAAQLRPARLVLGRERGERDDHDPDPREGEEVCCGLGQDDVHGDLAGEDPGCQRDSAGGGGAARSRVLEQGAGWPVTRSTPFVRPP